MNEREVEVLFQAG